MQMGGPWWGLLSQVSLLNPQVLGWDSVSSNKVKSSRKRHPTCISGPYICTSTHIPQTNTINYVLNLKTKKLDISGSCYLHFHEAFKILVLCYYSLPLLLLTQLLLLKKRKRSSSKVMMPKLWNCMSISTYLLFKFFFSFAVLGIRPWTSHAWSVLPLSCTSSHSWSLQYDLTEQKTEKKPNVHNSKAMFKTTQQATE